MHPRKFFGWLLAAIVCVIALPAAARAQSAIGGTVKDTSGAVLPGVTVEVASDVLIEKTKTVSTDGEASSRSSTSALASGLLNSSAGPIISWRFFSCETMRTSGNAPRERSRGW